MSISFINRHWHVYNCLWFNKIKKIIKIFFYFWEWEKIILDNKNRWLWYYFWISDIRYTIEYWLVSFGEIQTQLWVLSDYFLFLLFITIETTTPWAEASHKLCSNLNTGQVATMGGGSPTRHALQAETPGWVSS